MSLNNPYPGPSFVAEFTTSPIPWVTSSVANGVMFHRFGDTTLSGSAAQNVWLSKWVVVSNASTGSDNLIVAFTSGGLDPIKANYLTLKPDQSFSADLRISEIWLSGSNVPYEVIAGLTGINARLQPRLTGSSGYPCVG